MIAAWMLTVVVLGAVLLAAAAALDSVCARLGRPRRWIWAGAMFAMCLAPFAPRPGAPWPPFAYVTGAAASDGGAARDAARASSANAAVRPAQAALPGQAVATPTGVTRELRRAPAAREPIVFTSEGRQGNLFVVTRESRLVRLDRPLLAGWSAMTLVGLLLVVVAVARLRRDARRWTRADVASHAAVAREAGRPVPVWRSHDLGPAAVGLRAVHVVVPRWIDELPAAERALLLAHEAAHVRARDPLLLASALAFVLLLPWHVPLLVAYRRLCRAVEHDCDARVLARHGDARGYGRLLVRTAEWLLVQRSGWRGSTAAQWILAPVPAFAAQASELEARLRALVRPRAGWRSRLATVTAGACALAALVIACAVPSPTRGAPGARAGVAALPPSLRDSIRLYERVNSVRMRSRIDAVKDSLIDVAAREALAGLDTLTGVDTLYAWVLMDDDFRPVTARIAPRHRFTWSLDLTTWPRRPVETMATPSTPASRLVVNVMSWARAFPLLDPDRVNDHGGHRIRVGNDSLLVEWARLHPGDSTSTMIFRAAGTPPRIPAWFRTVAQAMAEDSAVTREQFRRALDTGLRENLRWRIPEALDSTRTEDDFVWLVLGPTGDAIAHATGRDGLGMRDPATLAPGRPLPRATASTPIDRLTIDDLAWRAKFPTLGIAPASFGWTSISVGPRTVHVLWALNDLSLVDRSKVASRSRTTGAPVRTMRLSSEVATLDSTDPLASASSSDSARAALFREIRMESGHGRLVRLLRATIARGRPDLLRGRRTEEEFVWLMFDSTGRVMAADTGRAGLGVKGDFTRRTRASSSTRRDSLVVHGDVFRNKFGSQGALRGSFGARALDLPNGPLNVIWTVAARD